MATTGITPLALVYAIRAEVGAQIRITRLAADALGWHMLGMCTCCSINEPCTGVQIIEAVGRKLWHDAHPEVVPA